MSIFKDPAPQGEGSFDPKDAMPFVYSMCVRAAQELASHGKRLVLQCSTHTFEQHLNVPYMIAGPWHAWDIDDRLDSGVLLLRSALLTDAESELGAIVGRININDTSLIH